MKALHIDMKKDENNYIYGKHPVEEMLANDPARVQKIFIKRESKDKSFDLIKNSASKNKIPVSFVETKRIKDIAGVEAVNQGVVALISEVGFMDLKEFLANLDMKENPAVILLDEIEDPHNVGAIIRSAAAAGISGVIFGKHRQAPVTATVYKVSAGAAAKIFLIRVANLNSAIEKLKESGFWTVALDQDEDADEHGSKRGSTRIKDNTKKNIWQADFDMPVCFILGNEGRGVRQKTLEKADFIYNIPMQNNVESLNVSATAAIVCFEWARRKYKK